MEDKWYFHRGRAVVFLLVALLPLLPACPTASVYRTARTLNQGEVDVGLLVSATHLSIPAGTTTDSSGFVHQTSATSVTFPNPVPELNTHYGVTDDVEIGCRLALSAFMGEVDLKLRLVGDRNSTTHWAIAPAVGYRALLVVEGAHATLPVIFTQDLNRDLAINLAGYGGYRNLHVTGGGSSGDFADLAISAVIVGGSVGLEFRGARGYFMPVVDVASTARIYGSASTGTQTYVIVGLSFGAVPGRVVTPIPPPPSYAPPSNYPPPQPAPPGYPPAYQPVPRKPIHRRPGSDGVGTPVAVLSRSRRGVS